jgi:hypothetical protein
VRQDACKEASVPNGDELLRLEYESAARLLGDLTEIRFKLLALVPTLSGAVVAFVSAGRSGVELLAIGALGLAATSGILSYELRNGELRRRATERVVRLEAELFSTGPLVGGYGRTPKLFGLFPASHRLGVGLVYGAALGGWAYLVVWGALVAAGLHHAQAIGVAVGGVVALAVTREIVVAQGPDRRPRATRAPAEA